MAEISVAYQFSGNLKGIADMFEHLIAGFITVISPTNLLFCFFGVTIGTIIGVLPGVGPVAGTAMLVPFTFGMNATTAIIMLAGIYYGAM